MKIVLDVDEKTLRCLRDALQIDRNNFKPHAHQIKWIDELLLQIPEEAVDSTPNDEEYKEFQDWFTQVMYDKKHFPSCFWRSVLRAGRGVMQQAFVRGARKHAAINEQLFGDKENNFYK